MFTLVHATVTCYIGFVHIASSTSHFHTWSLNRKKMYVWNQYVWKLLVVRYKNNTSHSIITYCEAHIRNNESKHRWAGWACGNGSCVDKKAAQVFLASSLRGLTFSQLFMSQRLLSQTHTWERSTTWFLWVLWYTPTVSELQVCGSDEDKYWGREKLSVLL